MGHKNLKKQFLIDHIVHVTPEGICIGSPYAGNLIVIGLDGTLIKRATAEQIRLNPKLKRYMDEMRASPNLLRMAVQVPDTFEASIPVYTYAGGEIIEKFCEKPGYPNVTHDGCLMYENLYSTDKNVAIQRAKQNAKAEICGWLTGVEQTKDTFEKAKACLTEAQTALAKLEATYPDLETNKSAAADMALDALDDWKARTSPETDLADPDWVSLQLTVQALVRQAQTGKEAVK